MKSTNHPASKKIRILIADDHPLILEGLRRILDEPDVEIVGTVSNGVALLRAASALRPDVIIVDIAMPMLNGIDATRQIRNFDGRVKIIVLTMHTDVTYATTAFEVGASAYVLKNAAGAELLTALRSVLRGRLYVSKSIAEAVAPLLPTVTHSRKCHALTPRRREVLQLLAEGRTAKEIATILNISHRTVEFHKYNLMDKLGLKSTAELARYAIKQGIIE